MPEHRQRAGAGTVVLAHTVVAHVAHHVQILLQSKTPPVQLRGTVSGRRSASIRMTSPATTIGSESA
jgi:hypothetical protein